MSHVDEGDLTAYADGAYAPGDPVAQRIEAHLAECASCRNLLAQTHALSARATEILAAATPAPFEMPAFETVSAAAARPRRGVSMVPYAWAATVVLALGMGWMARDFFPVKTAEAPTAAAEVTAIPPSTPAPAGSNQVATAPDAVAEERAPAGQSAGPNQGAQIAGRRADASAQPQALNTDEVAQRVAPSNFGVAAPVAVAPPPAAPRPAVVAEVGAAASARAQSLAKNEGLRDSNIEYITAAEAERRRIVLHVVPELEVLRVGLRSNETIVEQKLPDGKVVTLTATAVANDLQAREFRQEAKTSKATESVAADAMVANRLAPAPGLVVTRGNTRITVLAPVSFDSLKVLAAKVR